MTKYLLALTLLACGGDDEEPPATDAETHERVTCGESWSNSPDPSIVGQPVCDAPCAETYEGRELAGECVIDEPPTADRTGCSELNSVRWRGREGCCLSDPQGGVTFYAATCEDEQ